MNPYVPVIVVLFIGLTLGALVTTISHFLGPRRPNKTKNEVFECGVPRVLGQERMSVRFYLTAILFILFDIETVFLFLWATVFRDLGWFGVAEVAVFLTILVAGYLYVLKSGALEWD